MAWTTPKTWSVGDVLTASDMNTHVRDNTNECGAATVTATLDLVTADAANSLGTRIAKPASRGRVLVLNDAGTAYEWFAINETATNLTADTVSATGAYQDWGTETLNLAQPGPDFAVFAWLTGQLNHVGASGAADGLTRLMYSTNNGSSYSAMGLATRASVENGNISYATVAVSSRQLVTAATGNLLIKAEIQQSGGTAGDIQWENGRLIGLIIPS